MQGEIDILKRGLALSAELSAKATKHTTNQTDSASSTADPSKSPDATFLTNRYAALSDSADPPAPAEPTSPRPARGNTTVPHSNRAATSQLSKRATHAQTSSKQWPRGQHKPLHRDLASSASGRAPGCPRRYQRPDRRLGDLSHQAGPGVPWGSEPEPQRLWPSQRRHQPLVGQHLQEQRGEARGDPHRGQHVQVRRGHREHVEAVHQKAETCFPGTCRAGVFHRSSPGATEEDCPGLQRSAPSSVRQRECIRCQSHRRLQCPERCAMEAPAQRPTTSQ